MSIKGIGKYYEQRLNRSCPLCNEKLSIVLHGLMQEKFLNQLRENNIAFINAGCCCYGDDRDEVYYCPVCKHKFDDNLEVIKLIRCPRVIDYNIKAEECSHEQVLNSKYTLKSSVYCDACKILVSNEDDEYRKAAQILGLPFELVEQVIDKKNSNLRLKKNMDYKRYLCEEKELVHRLEHWDI